MLNNGVQKSLPNKFMRNHVVRQKERKNIPFKYQSSDGKPVNRHVMTYDSLITSGDLIISYYPFIFSPDYLICLALFFLVTLSFSC